jgi:hypothetical protein
MSRIALFALLLLPVVSEDVSNVASILPMDDQCAGAGDSSSCAFNALQVRGSKQVASARAGRYAPPAVAVSGRTSLGPMPTYIGCNVDALDSSTTPTLLAFRPAAAAAAAQQQGPEDDMSSSFSAGAGGESWMFSLAVIYLDPDSNSDATTLTLEVESANPGWTLAPASISVGGLSYALPSSMQWTASAPPGLTPSPSSVACPPDYCRMPAPPMGTSYEPYFCGFAPSITNSTAPAPAAGTSGVLNFDVTEFVAANQTTFKVWVTPSDYSSSGFWQTAQYTLTSFTFT